MSMKARDLTGVRFGRLVVVLRVENKGKEPRWLCKCDCGTEKVTYGLSLKSGNTTSCGCFAKEKTKERSVKHGMFGTKIWAVWQSMISRCKNKNHRRYASYGGRGITVCDRWIESFSNFYADMGDRPNDGYQIDRINNDEGYSPENCRWATRSQNMRNRSVTKRYDGLTLKEISEKTGKNYNTLKTRARRGQPLF